VPCGILTQEGDMAVVEPYAGPVSHIEPVSIRKFAIRDTLLLGTVCSLATYAAMASILFAAFHHSGSPSRQITARTGRHHYSAGLLPKEPARAIPQPSSLNSATPN